MGRIVQESISFPNSRFRIRFFSFAMRTVSRGKAGKNRKRWMSEAGDEKRELVLKEDGQEYAQVLRMLGNGRCEAMCIDGTKRICDFRGMTHKKVWISAGDIVLIGLRDCQDDKPDVILRYMLDEARLLKAHGELPDSTCLNEGIAGGLNEEDEGAGDLYSSDIKISELPPQAEIKEMEKKGNDSPPPAKKQKENNGITLRDDFFNKFGLDISQYIHSHADYYASLSLPKFMKHFHNQVMIVDRMASHLGNSTNKAFLQKEELENNIKMLDFAKNDALKRFSFLQEEVATIEAARDKAIAIAKQTEIALAETKELLAASAASDQGHIAETTELKVEIAELKKRLEETLASQASTSTKLRD